MKTQQLAPVKRKFDAFTSVVTFLVGPDKIPIEVARHNLCSNSPVLTDAIGGTDGFSRQTHELPDDDPVAVSWFAYWINEYNPGPMFKVGEEAKDYPDKRFDLPIRVLCFTEKYAVKGLDMFILGELSKLATSEDRPPPPPLPLVEEVYRRTEDGSGVRTFVVDWYAWWAKKKWYDLEEVHQGLLQCPKFAVDLLQAKAWGKTEKQNGKSKYPFAATVGFFYSSHYTPPSPSMFRPSTPRTPDSIPPDDHMPWAIDDPLPRRSPSEQSSTDSSSSSEEEEEGVEADAEDENEMEDDAEEDSHDEEEEEDADEMDEDDAEEDDDAKDDSGSDVDDSSM